MTTTYRPFGSSIFFAVLIVILSTSCGNSPQSSTKASAPPKKKVSFKNIEGIAYTEVRRQYDDSLGFNQYGYRLEPEWQITFLPKDSIRIFSLVLQKFITESVKIDHDSVANIAHSWIRVKQMSRDSLLFQVLYVKDMKIDDIKGQIFMKLYSNDLMKNKLHTTAAELQKAPRRDSLFIKRKADSSRLDPTKAFAAYHPAVLSPKTPQVQVTKKTVEKADALTDVTLADNYLSPTYKVTIQNAYADFNYYMQVIVDADGKLHFVKPLIGMMEDVEHRTKIMKGIVEGYLSTYLNITPGSTLGYPHASMVLIRVIGTTKK